MNLLDQTDIMISISGNRDLSYEDRAILVKRFLDLINEKTITKEVIKEIHIPCNLPHYIPHSPSDGTAPFPNCPPYPMWISPY